MNVPRSSVEDIVGPLITKTYGNNAMSRSLVTHLASEIVKNDFGPRGREYGVMLICWDWFSGGDTAASVAEKIEAALT